MSACRIGFKAMGGHCEIVLDGLAEPDAQVISAPAMAEVLRIEQKFSRYLPQSVVSRIIINSYNHFATTTIRRL